MERRAEVARIAVTSAAMASVWVDQSVRAEVAKEVERLRERQSRRAGHKGAQRARPRKGKRQSTCDARVSKQSWKWQ